MIKEMQNLNQKLAIFGFEAKLPLVQSEADKSVDLEVSKTNKSDSEIIDDMFGTSG